ncbi:hypothetical protein Fleli_2334 [Bernardetia litoralis DSM 6794]|uniref:Uncharacterized protein n=1 Tax=Bernardetia litoralis (strain ATCC 23117 / DSM 6794 / NBRC 15988 / NCIMB 1366 / Fx l1 / Sio-4) TaxID=880071 RepID=I4AFL5_BERLS|nr:hypothetical protein [Bernardetia litoralis]AFM02750.1 hypothetical protein Fleli_0261 [Bernardetia litoralis DSM 6794]AFM04707.1 hypothetical protein Fleli_2334 [Bernardetia litoralis DSM 6794]
MEKYELEKNIWTETDFEIMGWHDSNIYKLGLTNDLELDIDYILKWNKPDIEGLPFTFWVAPATLVFRKIKNISFELNTAFNNTFEIENIEKTESKDETTWTIITRQGDIQFISEGFTQYIRQEPFFQFGQTISYIERYGWTLDRTTNQENPNRIREDIIAQRNKDFEHYENAKKRHLKRKESENLLISKENNEIELKEYLLKKKEIKQMLDYFDYWLKDTRFENY